MAKAKVLLVDDELEFVSALAERLDLRGIEARVAGSGEAALELVEAELPDLVVLDLLMPGMSGLEVLQRLKAAHPELPVILLTGHGATREGIEGMRLGAFDYLMKPLNIDVLIAKLNEAMTGKSGQPSPGDNT
jgi:DNA-binding response OmpR family regulator